MIARLLLVVLALALWPSLAWGQPTPPSNLVATATGSASIDLTWTGSTGGQGTITYRLERGIPGVCASFTEIAQPGVTSFTDVQVSPGTPYCYRVRAVDTVPNFSTYSNTATATTLNLRSINLAWDDNSPNGVNPTPETGFQIERCPGASCSNFSILTSLAQNIATYTDTTSPAPIAGYRVTALPLGSGYSNITYSTPPAPPSVLSVAPPSLSFTASVGANPPTQSLTISNGGGAGMNWTVSGNATWLSVAPSTGVDNAGLVVTVNTSGLASGSYSGVVTVTAPGASGSPAAVPISLSLFPTTAPGGGSSGRVR